MIKSKYLAFIIKSFKNIRVWRGFFWVLLLKQKQNYEYTNVNNDHFELKQIEAGLNIAGQLQELIGTKTRNLTPNDRMVWASINKKTTGSAKGVGAGQYPPVLKSPNVNYEELAADWPDRIFLALS